nr:hypothetical protein CFP56_18681 [Quercus suber]
MPIATLVTTNTALGRRIPYQMILFPLFFNKNKFTAGGIEIISSLISLTHSVKVFVSKWQSIRVKLEELHSGLIAIENSEFEHSHIENPAISGLLSAILLTTKECHDLARRCVDLSYSGKLLMQSDLNVILTKLDRHRRHAVLYKRLVNENEGR